MNILEVRPGANPVDWSGERAGYIGLDRRLVHDSYRARAQARIDSNPSIGPYALEPSDFLWEGYATPGTPRPDEVLMIGVVSNEETANIRNVIMARALRHVRDLGKVVVIEEFFAERARLDKIQAFVIGECADVVSPIDVGIYEPGQPEFDGLWKERMAHDPRDASRILVAQPL